MKFRESNWSLITYSVDEGKSVDALCVLASWQMNAKISLEGICEVFSSQWDD